MIQFNLLPDIKLDYIKARRTKHIVLLISLIVTSVTVGVAIILFVGVGVVQKRHLSNLSKDIQEKSDKLKQEKDIDKILTVQNQLNSLDKLHDDKPAAEKLGGYLKKITPNEINVSSLSVDFTANTMKFEGDAVALKFVNEFVDTMKFTEYELTTKDGQDKTITTRGAAFSKVVLDSFDRTDGEEGYAASYAISLSFDPVIFDQGKEITKVTLEVPKEMVTTRSVTERPTPLFQQKASEGEEKEE